MTAVAEILGRQAMARIDELLDDYAASLGQMLTHKSYHSSLIEALKDPEEAAAYLEVVLEDGDLKHILLARNYSG